MSDKNLTQEQELHVEAHVPYATIFWVLLLFTIAEYFYAYFWANASFVSLVFGLMAMAITKATLVGMYFMHLKFEGKWVYGMLVPAGILAVILTLALAPDVAMQPVIEENPDTETEKIQDLPVQPGAAAWVIRPGSGLG